MQRIPIGTEEDLTRALENTGIKEIVDKVASECGYDIVYIHLLSQGILKRSKGSYMEIYVRKSDPPEEKYITIVHELLHVYFESVGKFTESQGMCQAFENLLDREAKKLIAGNPDLPTYILSKAKRIEGADSLDEFFQVF